MNSLQQRLNNYEVVPPPSAWDKIAASLDENADTTEFPSKLYNMELAPPASAWAAISSTLDTPADAKVVPLRKMTAGFYRYAAAALVIGIILTFGIVKWMSGSNHRDAGDLARNASPNSSAVPKSNSPAVTPAIVGAEATPAESPVEKEPAQMAQLELPVKSHTRRIAATDISTADYSYDETSADVYSNPIYAYDDHLPNLADRYIMLMTPEGKFIRMSKKWGNLVCCVSGEEQDADCKDQLKKWQEKIATSTLAPSPGNFLDILSLVSSLEDNSGL